MEQASLDVIAAETIRQNVDYQQEVARVKELLEECGINLDSMPSKARLSADLICKVCAALNLAGPSPEHALLAWAELKVRECKATVLKAKLKQLAEVNKQDIDSAATYDLQLRHCSASIQASQQAQARKTEQERNTIRDLKQKDIEYRQQAKKSAMRLQATGLTQGVKHSGLVAKGQRVAALQQQLADMKAKYQSYHSLPPSVLGAGMMLRQAKERGQQMQARLDAGLADLETHHNTF